MAKITYLVAASLDGYIADADGGVDWLPQGNADDYGYAEFYAGVEAMAMGRRTYDQVLGFGRWPYAGKPTYVFTTSPPDDNPHGVEFVCADATDFAANVAAQHSGTVWLAGGGRLAEQFRSAGLIEEYLIYVIPIILGHGVPLFGGDAPPTTLRLEEARTFAGGAVMLRYRPAHPPDSGSRPE